MLPLAVIKQPIIYLMGGDIKHCIYDASQVGNIDTRSGHAAINE
tara:strand:+ start:231 stop:362 length:132 start_codon:yes stop_codon:yes gene_type:complete